MREPFVIVTRIEDDLKEILQAHVHARNFFVPRKTTVLNRIATDLTAAEETQLADDVFIKSIIPTDFNALRTVGCGIVGRWCKCGCWAKIAIGYVHIKRTSVLRFHVLIRQL